MTEGFWEVVAHEIGHTYGVTNSATAFVPKLDNAVPSGFEINTNLYTDMMAESNCGPIWFALFNNYPYCDTYNKLDTRWISGQAYDQIRSILSNPVGDPQVFTVAMLTDNSSNTALLPSVFLPNGRTTPDNPAGTAAVNLLDENGALINQTRFSFANTFTGLKNGPVAVTRPFALVTVPFAPTAEMVQIVSNGVTLKTYNPSSQLLLDAVTEIPDTSFVKKPKKTRAKLLRLVHDIERDLEVCKRAHVDRDNDDDRGECFMRVFRDTLHLRDMVEDDLNDSTLVTSALQHTKPYVLRVADAAALHLLPNKTVRGPNHAFQIQIIPEIREKDDRGDFAIISVTQGANGSVAINRDGSVTYKPLGAGKADKFTVTVRDAEGDTAVKTVTVNAAPEKCDEGR